MNTDKLELLLFHIHSPLPPEHAGVAKRSELAIVSVNNPQLPLDSPHTPSDPIAGVSSSRLTASQGRVCPWETLDLPTPGYKAFVELLPDHYRRLHMSGSGHSQHWRSLSGHVASSTQSGKANRYWGIDGTVSVTQRCLPGLSQSVLIE